MWSVSILKILHTIRVVALSEVAGSPNYYYQTTKPFKDKEKPNKHATQTKTTKS